MRFLFYPKHEYNCPNVQHCPHLGGAALGNVVLAANENDKIYQAHLRQIDTLREQVGKQYEEIERLKEEKEQLKRELKAERQKKFKATTAKDQFCGEEESTPAGGNNRKQSERKRGAPLGHPGWFRQRPRKFDQRIDVKAPCKCSDCGGEVRVYADWPPDEHSQEDMVDGRYQAVLYRHEKGRCKKCRRWVQKAGPGELLGSRVGPKARAMGMFLHNDIGVSSRKVSRALAGIGGITFVPASLLNFEKTVEEKADPLVEDITKKVASSDVTHADETYWSENGRRAYFWFHGNERYAHFEFSESRAGQVSRDILGEYFDGILITDCYSGYGRHRAQAKQKCLAHLRRTALDWLELVPKKSQAADYFRDVVAWVKRACRVHRQRSNLSEREWLKETTWLREELKRLESCPLEHDKAKTLQQRLLDHPGEWLVFLNHAGVEPTNNLAERALRPLVILRKVTFGHRTSEGARRFGKLMTVIETAKRHGRNVLDLLMCLQTSPAERALRYLYDTS